MRSTEAHAPATTAINVAPRPTSSGDIHVLPRRSRSVVHEIVALLRPHHWVKNIFVLVPLLLTPTALSWGAIGSALLGVVAFCAIASAVYVMNDYMDREADRNHPEKRYRPLAAGTVPAPLALSIMGLLLLGGFAVASSLAVNFVFLLGTYFLLNVGYSLGLKRIPIVDVMIITLGFVLRVEAGASLIGVATTEWITIMTGLLALLLALGKRRDDVINSMDASHRSSLVGYNRPFLDNAMTAVLGSLLMTYIIYTTDQSVAARMHSDYLFYTTPFVAAGIMRYLQILFVERRGSDPTDVVLGDRVLQGTILGWALCFGILLYA
jgi:decaprenyl-phosphate phosphoribosyltransferase